MKTSIDSGILNNIFNRMLRIRHIENEIAERYSKGLMRCPTHLSIGQECVPSVIGELTSAQDKAVSTHRCHANYLGKGGNLQRMISEIYGKEDGCSKGKGGSMHLIDKSVGFGWPGRRRRVDKSKGLGAWAGPPSLSNSSIVIPEFPGYLWDSAPEQGSPGFTSGA